MTAIVAYQDKYGTAVLVADRVWYGYGAYRVAGRKIFAYKDCVAGFAGGHRSVAICEAKCFTELISALEKQADVDALIIKDNQIYHYITCDGKPTSVRKHGYEGHFTIGSYHNPVNYAISQGAEPAEAVQRVHALWNLDELVDIADSSWCEMPD